MALMSIFAILAIVLAAVGLPLSYSVSQRTREIGIAMALGAESQHIWRTVVGKGMLLAAVGLGVGILLAAAATRLLESLLFGIAASDPATFVGVSIVLLGVALMACYVPSRRAMKVDPVEAST